MSTAMTHQELKNLAAELSALSVFRGILEKKEMAALLDYLRCEGDPAEQMARYGAFVASLAGEDYCFSAFLSRAVCEDENRYVVTVARGNTVAPPTEKNALAELELFSRLTGLDAAALTASVAYEGYCPVFENHPIDFRALYARRLAEIHRVGYGIFATAGMFQLTGGEIQPVEAPDPISLDRFVGYEEERKQILENTRALLEGRPAANALLCGDAGTGKSSTVKACANYFYQQGLRLIELRKDQLFSLPAVMGRIAGNPLKFIIFIDDLSFNKNDDCFSMLKAALEGSSSARAENAVIYATSNRRHIVKEQFSDRASSDDIHHNDTVQELLSLSDRFGLVVYFSRPSKALYLEIIHELARRWGVKLPEEELERRAEVFALAKGSRSPRAAEQFIKSLI